MTIMKGLWLEDGALAFKDDLPYPEISGEEALIRVNLAGICATDLELLHGYYAYCGIPGHEFVGEVISAPANPALQGKRVVGEINIACGVCDYCMSGRRTHCVNRTVLGIRNRPGAFADYLSLPISNLYVVPEGLKDEIAVFCEPLAAALQIQEQIHVQPGDRVLLVGAGRLGILIAQTLALTGCDLIVLARYPQQQAILKSFKISVVDHNAIPDQSQDLVVEATGTAEGFTIANQAVRSGGTIVLKSTYKGNTTVNFSQLVVREIRLIGSRCGPFAPALRMLANGLVNPLPLIDSTMALEVGISAFERAAQSGVLKVMIKP